MINDFPVVNTEIKTARLGKENKININRPLKLVSNSTNLVK